MKIFTDFLKGIAIGAGAIIPGVSSGVICVILGIYEQLIDSVLNLFNNFKENIKLLLPITFGGGIGVVVFGKLLNYLIYMYSVQINFIFIGLITGSIPELLKKIDGKYKFKFRYIFYLLISLSIGFIMVLIEQNTIEATYIQPGFLYLFFVGMFMSVGVIVPGVSSTVILMLLGVYSIYLNSIANINMSILLPIIAGLIVGSLICMKLIKFLLNKFYVQTFYSIIGFTIGSVFVLYPGFTFDIMGIISVLCFGLGFLIIKILERSIYIKG